MLKGANIEKAYALIIDISEYKDPGISRLNYTHADAEGIFKLLTDPKKLPVASRWKCLGKQWIIEPLPSQWQ